jgi:alpha-amylase
MESINGVMMQFFHWYNAPDGTLWNEFRDEIPRLKEAGFTAVWLPPAYKGAAGGSDVGYSVYDMYDLGEFDQKGSVRTKYGTREELLAAVSSAREAGIQIYWDIILNHRLGGDQEEEFIATPYRNDNRHDGGVPNDQGVHPFHVSWAEGHVFGDGMALVAFHRHRSRLE